jgi:LEA14-like dessication related protein
MRQPLFILITLLTFLPACSRIEEPEFRAVDSFRVLNLGLEEVKIGFGMTYFNPNNFAVTVKETGADVYLDQVFLGKFNQDSMVNVGSRADFTVRLSGTIPLSTFFQLNLKDIHKREVSVRADGSTKVGKAGIFITRRIDYQGKHRLDQVRF